MRSRFSKHLVFELCLPPGRLATPKVKKLRSLLVNTYGWVNPVSFSLPFEERAISPGEPFTKEMVKHYEATGNLMAIGKTEAEGLSVHSSPVYKGNIGCWSPTDKRVRSEKGREDHVQQVVELMRLVDSPFAYTGLKGDTDTKDMWWFKTPWHTRLEFLNDYSKGLPGLFWRTFLGPPFVRLFGDRLVSLPAGTSRDLGGGLWLIEPYLLPADAFTEEGKAKKRAIIEHLGKECFFDHERQLRPTRRPGLPYLDEEALERERERRELVEEYGEGAREVARGLRMLDFHLWEARHRNDEHPRLVSRVSSWALDHRDDPDFLDRTPEQMAELLRPAFERELEEDAAAAAAKAASAATADKASERVRTVVKTSEALKLLLHLGRVAEDAEKAGELLDPTQKAQIQGVAALAQLATPRTPAQPKRKTPRRKK